MSLVNLAHVCSHLQNASLARLGLTSVPYTKLHLSLALLLHKQGFFSQVKIGGPSPPASCFPGGSRDAGVVSGHPHIDRSPVGSTSALTEMVVNGKKVEELRAAGFGEEAIDFALTHRELDKEQLERDGWDTVALEFLLQHGFKTERELAEAQLEPEAADILKKYDLPALARSIDPEACGEDGVVSLQTRQDPVFSSKLVSLLKVNGFEEEDLKYFAQDQKYTQLRHLERDGVAVQAMGLAIRDRAFAPVAEQYRDPWQLEEEGVVTQSNRASRRLWLGMKYWNGQPVLSKAKMLSRPTKRIWLNHRDLGQIVRGTRAGEVQPMTQIGEVIAVSTDRGIMEARECVERKIGGMVLCRVY